MQTDHYDAIAPISTMYVLYACPVCKLAQIHGSATERYQAAQRCCAPRVCDCGAVLARRYDTSCGACESRKATEKWLGAKRVDVNTLDRYMIHAWGNDFFEDLDSYLERCADEDQDPSCGEPVIAYWQVVRVPDLAEWIHEDMPEDWDGMEVYGLQQEIEAKFKELDLGAYFPSEHVPVLPSEEEWAAYVRRLAGESLPPTPSRGLGVPPSDDQAHPPSPGPLARETC